MDHTQVTELLPWYVNSTLNDEERMAVEDHLRNCRECVAEVRELEEIRSTVAQLSEELPRPSPGLIEAAVERIRREEGLVEEPPVHLRMRDPSTPSGERASPVGWSGWLRPLFGAVAMFLLIVVGFQALRTREMRLEIERANQPRILQTLILKSAARGDGQMVQAGSQGALIQVDVIPPPGLAPLESHFSRIACVIKRVDAGTEAARVFAAPEQTTLSVLLPASTLQAGEYSLELFGVSKEDGSLESLESRHTFRVEMR